METYCHYCLIITTVFLLIGVLVGQDNETASVQYPDVTLGISATLHDVTPTAQRDGSDAILTSDIALSSVTRGDDAEKITTTGSDDARDANATQDNITGSEAPGVNSSSGDYGTESPGRSHTSAETFSYATSATGDKPVNDSAKGSEDVSGKEESGPRPGRERLEQVEVLDTCFRMKWSGINFVSSKIQINVTNNKTQDKQTFNVDATEGTLMVCDLMQHQSYLVELSDPGWTPGRVIEKFMWTLQTTPPSPPVPTLEYTTENAIAIKIYAVNMDLNTGPFSGFNIRLASFNESRNIEGPYAYHTVGSPKGFSVAILPNNVDQQFVIGENDDGRSKFLLKKDTDYEIFVGTVSTVAHISTHAYVSIIATTCVINIHVIIMFLCFVVGFALLSYALAFIVWKRKNAELKNSKEDDITMSGEMPESPRSRPQAGDGLNAHKDSSPLAPRSPQRLEGSGD